LGIGWNFGGQIEQMQRRMRHRWSEPATARTVGRRAGRRPWRGPAAARTLLLLGCATSLLCAACGGGGPPGAGDTAAPTVRPSTIPPSPGSPPASGSPAPAARPLAGKVILVDPGHNGADAKHPEIANKPVDVITKRKPCDSVGTQTDDGYAEHAFNWDVAKRLAKRLRELGAKVVLTRSDNRGVGPCITRRAAIGNEAKADAAVSIHADGAARDEHGFHVIVPKPIRGHNESIVPASLRLGTIMREAYREGTGLPYSTYRGEEAIDARDDLGGLNLSTRPKVFIECGNMKNSGDAAKLKSGKFRERIAEAIATGFTRFLTGG
jgi:N-acetylmuramoyl-L-alanine amidase